MGSDDTRVIANIANFARKALVRCLPTNANLHRWDRSKTELCPHCCELETQHHILNNCSVAAVQGRYTWRHNAVLRLLVDYLLPHMLPSDRLLADLPGQLSPSDLYTDILPDITLVRGSDAHILELTCCAEVNFLPSRLNKLKKYAEPSRFSKEPLTLTVILWR